MKDQLVNELRPAILAGSEEAKNFWKRLEYPWDKFKKTQLTDEEKEFLITAVECSYELSGTCKKVLKVLISFERGGVICESFEDLSMSSEFTRERLSGIIRDLQSQGFLKKEKGGLYPDFIVLNFNKLNEIKIHREKQIAELRNNLKIINENYATREQASLNLALRLGFNNE